MNRTLIIAEAGVNHNGDINIAYRLCDAAKEVGADVVKFQTWNTDRIITREVEQAEYQRKNTHRVESQYEMLKRLELSYDEFSKIKLYCDKIGITFASTADDCIDLEFLNNIGIPFAKVGSADIGNIPLLRKIGELGLSAIISTGMSGIEDVEIAVNTLKMSGCNDITILHCTTSYPCRLEDVNLNAMKTLEERFHFPVGYSDHTIGNNVAIAAVAMGARVIEKHFTLDKKMDGPDHLASTEPNEMRDMILAIRDIENALGDGEKAPTTIEKEISEIVKKRIVAAKPIKRGECFTVDNLSIKRSASGVQAKEWDRVLNHMALRDYETDEGIE